MKDDMQKRLDAITRERDALGVQLGNVLAQIDAFEKSTGHVLNDDEDRAALRFAREAEARLRAGTLSELLDDWDRYAGACGTGIDLGDQPDQTRAYGPTSPSTASEAPGQAGAARRPSERERLLALARRALTAAEDSYEEAGSRGPALVMAKEQIAACLALAALPSLHALVEDEFVEAMAIVSNGGPPPSTVEGRLVASWRASGLPLGKLLVQASGTDYATWCANGMMLVDVPDQMLVEIVEQYVSSRDAEPKGDGS